MLGGRLHKPLHRALAQVDYRFVASDALDVGVPKEFALDLLRKVGIPRLPTAAFGVLPFGHA